MVHNWLNWLIRKQVKEEVLYTVIDRLLIEYGKEKWSHFLYHGSLTIASECFDVAVRYGKESLPLSVVLLRCGETFEEITLEEIIKIKLWK